MQATVSATSTVEVDADRDVQNLVIVEKHWHRPFYTLLKGNSFSRVVSELLNALGTLPFALLVTRYRLPPVDALQGHKGASAMAGAVGKSSETIRESSAMIAPKISSGVRGEAVISAPLQSATPLSAPEANIALTSSSSAAGFTGGARLKTEAFDGTAALNSTGQTITDANNSNLNAPNVGIDGKGFAVPMTPKQLEKAREYQSDCKQDTDNLKRLAKREHNKDALDQLDRLKGTVNELDNVEKHFQKRPRVVIAPTAEQISGSA